MSGDFYEILGVSREASQEEIKRAYRGRARQYHPDVNPEEDAEEKFKELSLAYSVLSDPQQRQRYDRYGYEAVRNGGNGGGAPGGGGFGGFGFPIDLEDLISSFFGGGGATQTDSGRGSDLRYDLELTLEEVLTGCERQVEVSKPEYCSHCDGSGAEPGHGYQTCATCRGAGRVARSQSTFFGQFTTATTCPTCHGAGRVVEQACSECRGEGRSVQQVTLTITVPPGVEDGDRMRLRGQGEAGRHGGPPGDLYVVCHVKDHDRFDRRGTELATEIAITFSQAALGDQLQLTGLDGEELTVDLPAGTQTGSHFRLAGKGLPAVRNAQRRGELHVFVRVHTPSDLTAEEQALFRQLAELRNEDVPQEPRGFFRKVWERIIGD